MRITLYTRAGCGPCREAEEMLLRLRRKIPFELEFVDIDSDLELVRRYGDRVPVVAANGKGEVAAPLSEGGLRALLSA